MLADPLGALSLCLWPFLHLYNIIQISQKEKKENIDKNNFHKQEKAPGYPTGIDDFLAPIGILILVSLVAFPIYYFTYFEPSIWIPLARNLDIGWILNIITRDLILSVGVACFWDYILYFSPWANGALKDYKYNPKIPSKAQMEHDAIWTCVSSLVSSVLEIFIFYCMAMGFNSMNISWNFFDFPLYNVLWLVTMPWWRIAHFYFIHRMIHPWKTKSIPDFGKVLYQKVHSLHHLSRNPTALSGISMHPVEGFLYFSILFFPTFFNIAFHPFLIIVTKTDLILGAVLGHDGFGGKNVGHGSRYHWIHHERVECNYGETMVPFDYFFGTFRAE